MTYELVKPIDRTAMIERTPRIDDAVPVDDPDAEGLPWYFWVWAALVALSIGTAGLGIAMSRWWTLILLIVIVVGLRAMWRVHRTWVDELESPEQFDDGDE